ncbi:hypothetical protein CROQUDRAFT_724030 [Cronartium quercuum f. sp. fusiforme G11]|uniref:Uncharacterized protein n=1 Tax=Cronartium quercuum f. sp. fusiforme G11 TaxID=708437 RepID=A0A9P6NE31_9BASI|nr:hypothetical protein CROQUDRAFT_724030 [Cronartium quercuum f. sp. fusiforme G11]
MHLYYTIIAAIALATLLHPVAVAQDSNHLPLGSIRSAGTEKKNLTSVDDHKTVNQTVTSPQSTNPVNTTGTQADPKKNHIPLGINQVKPVGSEDKKITTIPATPVAVTLPGTLTLPATQTNASANSKSPTENSKTNFSLEDGATNSIPTHDSKLHKLPKLPKSPSIFGDKTPITAEADKTNTTKSTKLDELSAINKIPKNSKLPSIFGDKNITLQPNEKNKTNKTDDALTSNGTKLTKLVVNDAISNQDQKNTSSIKKSSKSFKNMNNNNNNKTAAIVDNSIPGKTVDDWLKVRPRNPLDKPLPSFVAHSLRKIEGAPPKAASEFSSFRSESRVTTVRTVSVTTQITRSSATRQIERVSGSWTPVEEGKAFKFNGGYEFGFRLSFGPTGLTFVNRVSPEVEIFYGRAGYVISYRGNFYQLPQWWYPALALPANWWAWEPDSLPLQCASTNERLNPSDCNNAFQQLADPWDRSFINVPSQGKVGYGGFCKATVICRNGAVRVPTSIIQYDADPLGRSGGVSLILQTCVNQGRGGWTTTAGDCMVSLESIYGSHY